MRDLRPWQAASTTNSLRIRATALCALAALAPAPGAETPAKDAIPQPVPLKVAVLPVQNRSDEDAPLERIRRDLSFELGLAGISVLEEPELAAFMRRHRMRYTGGIHEDLALAMEAELKVEAVLITSLDLFRPANPPKAGLTCRLVSTGPDPRILWMDSASDSGDASPGFLGLGLVAENSIILGRVIDRIVESAETRGEGAGGAADRAPRPKEPPGRFRPKIAFRSPGLAALGRPGARIAILPLANASTTSYAGEIVTDQLIRQMVSAGLNVVEPGIVRHTLLETRQIQPNGPSIPQAEVLHASMDVDRILFGEVNEYREASGGTLNPVVDFSVRAIDTATEQVIWSSISHTRGNERVFFFDAGRIATAHEVAARMASALVAEARRAAPAPAPVGRSGRPASRGAVATNEAVVP